MQTRAANRAELLRNPICKTTNINHTITQLKSCGVLCKKNEGKILITGRAVTLPNFVLIFHSKRTIDSLEIHIIDMPKYAEVGTSMARIPLRAIFTFYHVCHTKNDTTGIKYR